jgi:hypothetical protein
MLPYALLSALFISNKKYLTFLFELTSSLPLAFAVIPVAYILQRAVEYMVDKVQRLRIQLPRHLIDKVPLSYNDYML